MTPRPGWPAHRPKCRHPDDGAVRAVATRVGQATWLLRTCADCREVALELVAGAAGVA